MSVEVGGVVRLVDESMDDELLAVLIFFDATVVGVGKLGVQLLLRHTSALRCTQAR